MSYPYYDLREAIQALEEKGLMKHVKTEVDKNWELSSVMRWVYQGYPEDKWFGIVFDKVKGYDMSVVVGVYASYKSYAVGLGIDIDQPRPEIMKEIRQRWTTALHNPLTPKIVKTGPCKQNIMKGSDVNIHKFPIPVWNPEKDANWDKGYGFLTSPYHITKDSETGIRNVGTYRNMIREEPNVMGMMAAKGQHVQVHMIKNEVKGKATEIATVLGADPAIGMTSVTHIPYNLDELAVAGGLRGAPLEMVKCETVDIEVPATAEIVIEGRIPPRQERPYEMEAPFGEYLGYEGGPTINPVYEINCITYRDNAVYQAFISQMPPCESDVVGNTSFEAFVLRGLETAGIEGVVDVHMPHTSLHGMVFISIKKRDQGHAARVAYAYYALVQPRGGKFVVVVDDDVDIYDLENVLWAIVSRTSLAANNKRVTFIEGLDALALDHSAAPDMQGWRQKWDFPCVGVLIDATRPYAPFPMISLPPAKYLERVRDMWDKYGLPDLDKKELPKYLTMEEEYIKQGIVAPFET